jgi:hypothetical protein
MMAGDRPSWRRRISMESIEARLSVGTTSSRVSPGSPAAERPVIHADIGNPSSQEEGVGRPVYLRKGLRWATGPEGPIVLAIRDP